MREEIQLYINDTFTPELNELFNNCFEVFELFDLPEYDNQYIDFLMDVDNSDRGVKSSQFILLVKENLLSVIHEHAVQVNAEASLEAICEIAKCLSDIQNYEDIYGINRILETDLDYVEKLASLFNLVSSFSVDYFVTNIDYVDSAIFIKLSELYPEVEENNKNVTEEVYNELLTNIKQFITIFDCNNSILINKLKQGLSLGLPFTFYCDLIKSKIETIDLNSAAIETAIALQLAVDTYKSPISSYAAHSGDLFDSIETVTKINVALVKIFNDYEKIKIEQTTKKILNEDTNE